MLPFIVDPAGWRFRCGTGGPALPGLYFPGGRLERGLDSVAVVRVGGAPAWTGSKATLAAPAGRHYPQGAELGAAT